MSFQTRVKQYIQTNHLIRKGDRILIGISGGADSVALACLLKELRHHFAAEVVLAHYNHKLRKEADADEQFVRSFAESLNLPLVVDCWKNSRQMKGSIEEKARISRLSFLRKTVQKQKLDVVALAHHKNDQAETVLMRLLRGSGLKGSRAMLPDSNMEGIRFIRPFLDVTREDIEKFLKTKKILYREDRSNLDPKFFRNKVRHELIPLLEKEYNKGIQSVLCGYADNAARDYAYIEEQTAKALKKVGAEIIEGQKASFPVAGFKRLPETIQCECLRQLMAAVKGHGRQLNAVHIKEITDLLANRPEGAVVDLPFGVRVKKDRGHVVIDKKA